MVKKIKKYAKFVVCMGIILGLMAPSYAALSASDGSAFVTKAEFDSALADFNARLTTFEAGINSKIDSQVTSYLDRNGIWSGKDQTLAEAHGWFVPARGSNDPSTYTQTGTVNGKTLTLTGRSVAVNAASVNSRGEYVYIKTLGVDDYGKIMTWYYADFDIVNSISKSGLCCVSISYLAMQTFLGKTKEAARTCITSGPNTGGSNDSSDVADSCIGSDYGYFYVNDWIDENTYLGKYAWAEHVVVSSGYGYSAAPVNGSTILYFFVNSTEKLRLRLTHAAIPALSQDFKGLGNKDAKITTCFPISYDGAFHWNECGTVFDILGLKVY